MQQLLRRLTTRDYVIIAGILGLIVVHFLILRVSPPGFFVDEAVTGAHVRAMLEKGTDANGTVWPLFSESVGGGYTTPVYLYPLTAWSALFGTSEYALRAFSVVVTLIALFVLGIGMRIWFGKKALLLTWLVGLLLPWAWLSSYLAWDPVMVPLFIAFAWLGFSMLVHRSNKHRTLWLLLLGTALLLSAYTYPPFRVGGPLLLAAGVLYAYRFHHIKLIHIGALAAWCGILALPLAFFLLQPEAMGRSQSISVFTQNGFIGGVAQILFNYLLILNPVALFVTGDPNLRHSTGMFGMLGGVGLIGAIGLISVFRAKDRLYRTPLALAGIGAVLSILGSALTNEGQPHFLRATGAWPFFVILLVIGWLGVIEFRKRYYYAALSACSLITIAYVADLTLAYPERSAEAFDYSVRKDIKSGAPVNYPEKALRYYR